jgi:hypothetical protein
MMGKLTEGRWTPPRNPHRYGSPEFIAALNADLWATRRDIEWTMGAAGAPVIQDNLRWEIDHDKAVKAQREKDRQDWKHRQRYPATAK